MRIRIRNAHRNDFAAILNLNNKLFKFERQWGKTYDLSWTYSPTGRAYFAGRIENGIVLVAETDGKIVGYLCAYVDTYPFRSVSPLAEIENMYVEETYRKLGVGSKLISKLKEELSANKVKRLKVQSIFQNISAIEFYKRNGFHEHGVVLEQNVTG